MPTRNRITWLTIILGAVWTTGTVAPPACAAEPTRKPNFVLILSDDQRWDMLSVVQEEQGPSGRFPFIKTPNLDRIAAEGVRFRNAFVVNSLCAPSRASFLTGNYGHVNGIVNNHTPFSADNATWSTALRKTGYRTAYIGKWHMGHQTERPGFDFSASFVGQGVYHDCKFLVDGKPTPSKGYVDNVSIDYAIQFMRAARNRPFAMTIGLKATHGPFTPPQDRNTDYTGETARRAPNLTATAIYRGGDAASKPPPADDGPVKTNLGYVRCIAGIDDNVGRILATLDELGLADDTMLVFAGDNGYYLGEHGLGDKRSAYDESLRIPLLVRYPRGGLKGVVNDDMVLNVDMAPTWLDYAGVTPPRPMHGRSWRPLFESQAANWRKAWFYCYYFERPFTTPMTTAVRTDTAKLIRYPGHDDWTELFDLATDPYEITNLYAQAEHADLRAQLEAEYARQAAAIGFGVPAFADVPRPGELSGKPAQRRNAWVLDYRFGEGPDEADGRIKDASAFHNNGKVIGALPVTDGRDGRKARRFDGKAYIEVASAPSLDPSRGSWTLEAAFKTERADGVIAARGGKSNGYALYLQDGRPTFAVTTRNKLTTVTAEGTVTGRWVDVRATITNDRRMIMTIDGNVVARGKLGAFIADDPNDAMQLGADEKSPVVEGAGSARFTGLIESVRLYSGEAP